MKILTIVGARPQFIKAAALSRELGLRSGVEEVIVHTGQHFDANMSDVFFTEMDIPKPKHNLHIHSLGHGAMTGRMLEGIEGLLMTEKPNMMLVYGDTNSTIAGALAAKKLHIPVGHVEAGLRSFNMKMPEEVNRILTDRISDHLFCPTQAAVDNLQREGFGGFDCQIHKSGDVMQDAALYYARISCERSKVIAEQELEPGFVLATIHRAENTDDPERLGGILRALNEINQERRVICPLHPRTRNLLEKQGVIPEFTVLDPVGYFDMIELLKAASMVMTDSGGLQKEAYFFQNPCITMRDETEWTELVSNGYNITVGASAERILSAYSEMKGLKMNFSQDLYGGGKAAAAIADALEQIA
ncbi:MAG: UDP-N-acetylglucosamine 2-epimerase (non-hydrolyzing) [Cryomorphaceae bacterium]